MVITVLTKLYTIFLNIVYDLVRIQNTVFVSLHKNIHEKVHIKNLVCLLVPYDLTKH